MIETLESRIAPAAIIDLTFSKGMLTAKTQAAGDGEETLTISQLIGGELRVDPDAGAQIRFQGQLFADGAEVVVRGVTGLSVALGKGNDKVSLVNLTLAKSVKIDLGSSANTLNVGNGSIGGAFTVLGGASADTVNFNGSSGFSVGGKTSLALGDGANAVNSTVPVFTTGDTFTYTGTNGTDTLTFAGQKLGFGGKFTANTGTAAATVQVAAMETLTFAGDVVMTSTNIDPAAMVRQTLACDLDFSIGGQVKFSATSGDVTQSLLADTGAGSIGRGITFAAGTGKSTQTVDTAAYLLVGGKVTATTKAQTTASVVVTTGSSPQGSLIKGNVTFTGHRDVDFRADATVSGSLSVRTGAGLPASVKIGKSQITDTRFSGNITIVTAENAGATSTITVKGVGLGGTATITGGVGNTVAAVDSSIFAGRVTVDLGAGSDTFQFETLGAAGTGIFYDQVILRGGAGADTFTIGGANGGDNIIFRSSVLIDGGADTDTVTSGPFVVSVTPATTINVP